ncbi:FAD-binding domain-containing protein [Ceratobasidium sp. AG-I]|nr:FAD-binding domain-containing protein [Ceratobasidium sp. AG-I]
MTETDTSPPLRIMSSIDPSALSKLRTALSPSATVHLPGDPEYSIKRWAGNAEKPAAIVVSPATPEDVVQILSFVQGISPYESQQRLDFAVKGGGHSPSGASSSDGGLVIDLAPKMHNVRVDPTAKVAYVGGGCLWVHVDEATTKYGLATVAGVVSHTGVGKLTLGGGFGWLCGQHGLAIDNLLGATVVTASGEILTASESQNSDLFWALRGGGGNFGVVTEFIFRLHEQRPDLYKFILRFPPAMIDRVIPELNLWLAQRTAQESGAFIFAVGPNGQPSFILELIYNGDSAEGAEKFKRFVDLGPIVHISETIPYIGLNKLLDAGLTHGDSRHFRGNFVPATSAGFPVELVKNVYEAWEMFVTGTPQAKGSQVVWELHSPEQWSKVPSDATAYVHRNPSYNTLFMIRWTDPAFTEQAPKAARDLDNIFTQTRAELFEPKLVGQGGYTNYLDEESRASSKEVSNRRFGTNFPRLVEVKKKYDSLNMFGKWFPIATS